MGIILIGVFPALFFRKEGRALSDQIWEAAGLGLILLGQLIRTSARGYKSEKSGQGNTLVTGGPYSLVRNPMYLGIFLIGIGVILIFFDWRATILFLLIFIARYFQLIFKEEKKLLSVFGKQYQEYTRQVPRIIPSPKMLCRLDISTYFPLKYRWLKREISTMAALLVVVLTLESWEDIKSVGLSVFLYEARLMAATILFFILAGFYLIRRTKAKSKDA